MAKVIYYIDGIKFETLEEFYEMIYEQLIPGRSWGKSLDDLQDLVGPYCTDDDAFRLVWRNSELSRERLGYAETIRQLELRKERCHPGHIPRIEEDIVRAQKGKGPTVFDWLVEIFRWPYLELVLE
jgi:RNAse (barnase) inhibitor barstar